MANGLFNFSNETYPSIVPASYKYSDSLSIYNNPNALLASSYSPSGIPLYLPDTFESQRLDLSEYGTDLNLPSNILSKTSDIQTIRTGKATNEYLKKASTALKIQAGINIASSVAGIMNAQNNYEAIKSSKMRIETQKKIMDRNIVSQETLMMQNYENSMANLDAMYAAKNVAVGSEAAVSTKERGAIGIGKDIAEARISNEFAKKAMDLEYKVARAKARSQRDQALLSGIFDIGTSSLMFL